VYIITVLSQLTDHSRHLDSTVTYRRTMWLDCAAISLSAFEKLTSITTNNMTDFGVEISVQKTRETNSRNTCVGCRSTSHALLLLRPLGVHGCSRNNPLFHGSARWKVVGTQEDGPLPNLTPAFVHDDCRLDESRKQLEYNAINPTITSSITGEWDHAARADIVRMMKSVTLIESINDPTLGLTATRLCGMTGSNNASS
jgi:hypothetical protein